jgi:hypothetical protein
MAVTTMIDPGERRAIESRLFPISQHTDENLHDP